MAVSLIINSSTISLALGSAFTKAEFTTKQTLVGLTCFTLVAPIAILIGKATVDEDHPEDSGLHPIINVILLSTATGMYLYHACSEVLVKEFADKGGVWFKIPAILVGLVIILGLVFIESGHDHGGNEDLEEICLNLDDHGHNHLRF